MNLEDISPETKEKAKACTTREELLELVQAESIELSEEQLDAINGGGDGLFNTFGKTCDVNDCNDDGCCGYICSRVSCDDLDCVVYNDHIFY